MPEDVKSTGDVRRALRVCSVDSARTPKKQIVSVRRTFEAVAGSAGPSSAPAAGGWQPRAQCLPRTRHALEILAAALRSRLPFLGRRLRSRASWRSLERRCAVKSRFGTTS